ncbi:MAG TPA: ADP-ribosylglycohydrolase family protein [Bacilli bacterium]|nr:ADP-ribosylglycohydrolase family protein [Bacilli bacterium]
MQLNYYDLSFALDELRPTYEFDVTCQGTVPPAIVVFLEANSFEEAIRNAISLGGDADTLAAITGSIAEAYWQIPADIRRKALRYLDNFLLDILNRFEEFRLGLK